MRPGLKSYAIIEQISVEKKIFIVTQWTSQRHDEWNTFREKIQDVNEVSVM